MQEAFKQYPELFSWITAQPDEALVKAFTKYREDLQCATCLLSLCCLACNCSCKRTSVLTRVFCCNAAPVCDEAPESLGVKEDGTPTGWITTATAVRILDDISQCAEVTTHAVLNAAVMAAVHQCLPHAARQTVQDGSQS